MRWIKHQTDSLDSPFIQELLTEFGAQGYLAYYGILEIVAKAVGYNPLQKVNFSSTFLKQKLHISSGKLREIFDFCSGKGELIFTFSKENFEFEIPKLAILKDNYSKDLQATGKKLAHHKEVEVDKDKKKRKNKKEPKPIVEIHEEIVNDLNLVLGTKYRHTTKGIRGLINARLEDKQTLEDFKKVHRNMFAAWNNDPKMSGYLRPDTLYTAKFQSYLNRGSPSLSQRGIVSEKTERNIEVLNSWLAKEEAKDKEATDVE